MSYPILASVFFFTCFISIIGLVSLSFPKMRKIFLKKFKLFYLAWFLFYFIFIVLFTGPKDIEKYPISKSSLYTLPWETDVNHFVSQGNRSFVSHRDFYEYSWDFWMANGTKILAARSGKVIKIVDSLEGIGLKSNYISIEHVDGTRAIYAHIQKNSVPVKLGDEIKQGQVIARSGMVGQTINPHLHFAVINKEGTSSIPISFSDVLGGVPMAGNSYKGGIKSNK